MSTNIRPSEWKDLRDTTLSERLMLIVRVIIQLKLIKNILRQFLLFFYYYMFRYCGDARQKQSMLH